MAMPASGCLGLRCCINAVACTSIGIAVYGSIQSPTCLLSASVAASKSAPHCMREFYSYAGTLSISVDVNYMGPPGGGDGLGGCVVLRGAGGTNCGTCYLSTYDTYDSWIWTPVNGTYCVDFSCVDVYCDYSYASGWSIYWNSDTSTGSGCYTNTFNTNEYVSGYFYPY